MSAQNKSNIPLDLPPDGTVTFLFSDIEGSTQLLNKLRKRYSTLLSELRRILREIMVKWHGHEIGTEGDSFFAAFPRATDALNAAVEIQRRLADKKWPDDVSVLLRVGLHTGEPWVDEEGYTGLDVHRAARITNVGHGGQVLLSETTSALVRDELPYGVSLMDLGLHRLKDMESREQIRQLVIQYLPSEFPPLNSLDLITIDGDSTDDLDFLSQTLAEAGIPDGKFTLDDILRVTTFGGLTIHIGTKPVTSFTSRKVEALLLYLACTRRPFERQFLAEMLWEGRSQTLAMSNLRVALKGLDKVFGDFLNITQDTVEMNPEAPLWLDVFVFEKMVNNGDFGSALKLYQGDFLEGFQIRSARAFEEWIAKKREYYKNLVQDWVDDNTTRNSS